MPNIAKVLREEISRIARKESKAAVAPVRKSTARTRPDVADLKNRVAILEKEIKRLNLVVINLVSTQPAPAEAPQDKAWISGRGVKTLRKKLGLSQAEFAKLTGVTTGAVTLWERKPGMLKLRPTTKQAVMSIRGITKAEARTRLDEMKPTAKKTTSRRSKISRGGKVRQRRK